MSPQKNIKTSLRLVAGLACFASLLCPQQVIAQFTFAGDNADNYGGAGEPGWTNTANAGTGFAAWSLASGNGTGGFGGNFLGDPNAAGITGFGTSAFAQFANSTGTGAFANADRSLSTAMQVGDTFSFQWAINWDSGTGGNKGFNLYTGGVGGTQLINVNNGNSATITINGADTGFTFGTSVMTWTFAYTGATTLVVTANDRDGSGTYSNSFTVAGALDAFRFYSSRHCFCPDMLRGNRCNQDWLRWDLLRKQPSPAKYKVIFFFGENERV